ncbi:MAG: hypothetical protein KAV82_00510 [Phycisphaerae bacterium]|nr:hypothetical protein [Phycisphaerae bacterium]
MTFLLRASTLLIMAVALLWVGGDRADGFSYFSYGGYNVIWSGGQSLRYLSPGTFPEGSETDTIIQLAMGQWTFVWGGGFEYTYYRLPEDPTVDHYDGYSDTAAVPAEWLDPGVLGVTYMVSNADLWYDMDILFSDFPENVGWHMLTNPDCEVTANPTPYNGFSFYLVSTHELGHGIGLGHDPIGDEPPGSPWFIATMNPGYPAGGPVGQNNIVELHTDDRRGVRFLYPGTPETKVDLAGAGYCSQGPSLGKAVPAFVDPLTVTPGEVLTGWCVIENLGTVSVADVHQGFYFSLDDVVDTDDLLMGDTRWDLLADDGYEFSVEIDVPDLLPGSYYFGSMLDDLNEVVEEYEDNNDAITCDPFTIAQAIPAFEPFSQQVITCDQPFTGPTPLVHYPINTAPIIWSLDNPQPDMTIDPDTGVISWPEPVKAPFEYDLDVRATNAAGTTMQTLRVAVHQAAAVIVPIADQVTKCGIDYTGPTPVLTAPTCMNPILDWALLSGPPGMTINPSSGVVFWPGAVPDVLPYTVSIRAINDAGETIETFLLTVGSAGGDLDVDDDVDLVDYELFEACMGGPEVAPASGCACADFDQDGDADLADFALLQGAFTGVIVHEGACCHDDGTCTEGDPDGCFAFGGTYLGDGTNCAAVDCLGACCFWTGGCYVFSPDDCATAEGTLQGLGTDCGELTCPPSGLGACCHPDESCTVETPADCSAAGGIHRGVGMSCEAADCTTPVGACCHSDGTCAEGSPAHCAATGGAYMGDGTICTSATCEGACCYSDGGCLDLSEPVCAVTAGSFKGSGTDCASTDCPVLPTGACCYADESCAEETEAMCDMTGGSYQGDDTLCSTTDCSAAALGACCLPDESCVEVTQVACDLENGTFIGETTTCASVDCSLTDLGACYDPSDWSCILTSPGICAALGGTFEGPDTTCGSTTAPEYHNDIETVTIYWAPGASSAMGDDITLSGTARGLIYYDLAVYGTGGGTYDVVVELYDDCPGEGGTLINGTQAAWNAIPADDYMYVISADLSADPVTIPDTVWMVATFSSNDAGWVLAETAEVGFTDDLFGEDDPPWVCDSWFGGPPNEYAGFYANMQCVEVPEGEGACCHSDETCTEGTVSSCAAAGGFYMGDDTTCGTVDCTGLNIGACCDLVDWRCTVMTAADCATAGGSYDGDGTSCGAACPEYQNEIDPASLSYNPGKPMADDLILAGTARDLSYFEIAVYGGGGGMFDVSTAFYDASPCAGGAPIPGTYTSGTGLPDNGQVLNLAVTFPTPVTLPDDVWLVVEFTTAYAGWIVAEEAEAGSTADYFGMATYNAGTEEWEWACDYQIEDPPNDPHSGFWVNVQCVNAGAGFRAPTAEEPFMTVTPIDLPAVRSGGM